MLRIGSLFSGYGGLDMAVRNVVGGELAWWSDIDEGAIRIMSHHHHGVPNIGDISTVDWSQVEPVDVLTGGFPCQDISPAGKRAGIRPGTRSGLWTQMAYAISQLRPRLVVIENVRNLVNAPAHSDVEPCAGCVGDRPAESALLALGAVLGDLADLGFDAEWVGLPASAVGAAHERWREFVVAYPAGEPWCEWNRDGADADSLGHQWSRRARGRRDGSTDGGLMPTPRATDGPKGGPNQRGSSGDLMLPSAVNLLPTPEANDGSGGRVSGELGGTRPSGAKRAIPLATAVAHLLSTPTVSDHRASGGAVGSPNVTLTDATVRHPERWGKYADAIFRAEVMLAGRPRTVSDAAVEQGRAAARAQILRVAHGPA